MTNTLGTLHGTWEAETAVALSDRRVKKDILPLQYALQDSTRSLDSSGKEKQNHSTVAAWVLRELRPVSFSFRHGPDVKSQRFGFVAQELQQVLPAIVRGQDDEIKHVVYQDLIALLTLAAQQLEAKMEMERESNQQRDRRLAFLEKYIERRLERLEEKLTNSIQILEEKMRKSIDHLEDKIHRVSDNF